MTRLQNARPMEAVLFDIADAYKRSRVPFRNGPLKNKKGENAASAAIFAYAMEEGLSQEDTLRLFGEHYQTVLNDPEGKSHGNIRQFMETGFEGLNFLKGNGLKKRKRKLSEVVEMLWGVRSDIEPESKFDGRNEIIAIFEAIESGYLGPVAVNMVGLGQAETLEEAQICCEVFPWVKQGLLIGLPKLFVKRRMGQHHDTLPTKAFSWKQFEKLPKSKVDYRMVPPGIRRGTWTPGTALMPNSWVNAGARVGSGTMVDAGATVGSCGYVGKNVHISGKAGLGGVFEPLGQVPVVVGDNAFIGLCSEPTEGVIVGPGAVIAPSVVLTQSTKIFDNRPGSITEGKSWYGFIPHDALAVPGTYSRKGGSLACVRLVKNMDPEKRGKVDINAELRGL